MASKPVTPDKTHIKCKIIDMVPDPKHPGRMLISIELDDGDPKGPWHQAFSIVPNKVITIDDLLNHLQTQELKRPENPYVNLEQAWKGEQAFVLDLSGGIEHQSAS
jgi:hypothetical protein